MKDIIYLPNDNIDITTTCLPNNFAFVQSTDDLLFL